jgi:hypothetical protein
MTTVEMPYAGMAPSAGREKFGSRLEHVHFSPISRRGRGGILADIAEVLKLGDGRAVLQLKRQAIMQFAELNGWTPSPHEFGLDVVGRGGRGNIWAKRPHFDHPIWFKFGRINVAVVGQPYADLRQHCHDGLTWAQLARKHRLDVSFPPKAQASIYSPGHAFFVVLHERTHTVRWLPEQVV